MKIVTATHQGLVRLNNEDAVLADEAAGWVALADGMGGLLAGEEASEIAVVAVKQALDEGEASEVASVSQVTTQRRHTTTTEEVLLLAHDRVKSHAESKNYTGKMGTTLIVWQWCDGHPEFCHVGDSRVYALAEGSLEQLSCDHTVAQRLVDEGVVAEEERDTAPHQNVLTQALGMPGMLRPQTESTPTVGRLLLCSDGLSDLVTDEELSVLLGEADPESCAASLLKAALDKGGRDNVTLALIDLD